MKMILRSATLLLIAMAVAFSGCTSSYEDQVTPEETLTEEEGTLVSFSLDVAEIEGDDDVTRAASSYESTIANLWILQYDSSGNIVWRKYITSSLSSSFSLTVHPSTSTLVFVANTSSTSFGYAYSTLTALQAATYAIAEHDDVLSGSYCIMSGYTSISSISATTTNTVTLKRNAAKVNVKIVNNLSSSEWTLLSIETLNIQTKSYYYTNYTLSTYFPSTSTTVTDYTWTSDEVTAGTGSSGITFYLPINKRGTKSSNSTASDKTENAYTGATAIRINFASLVTPFLSLSYTFYLGADMIDDYNLLGNYFYDCTFTLSGTGLSDSRVATDYDYYYTFYNDDATDAQKMFDIGISYVDHSSTLTWTDATETYPDNNATTTGRMPTEEELIAMWIFQKDSDGFTSGNYWSTDVDNSYITFVVMDSGSSGRATESTYLYARPVKEL